MGRVPNLNRWWYPSIYIHVPVGQWLYNYSQWLYIVLEHSRSPSPHKMISHHTIIVLDYLIINQKIIFHKKCSWGPKTHKFFTYNFLFKNVPGVLKRTHIGGGDFGGVWGAPRPQPGVARGRKTIHFFLWPWSVTSQNSGTVRLGGQKLSSGNLGGGRIKNKKKN